MGNNLLKFSEKLNEKKNKGNIIFQLSYMNSNYFSLYDPYPIIDLDEEDLDYFKNKYLPKMEDEYQANLAELNKKYNK